MPDRHKVSRFDKIYTPFLTPNVVIYCDLNDEKVRKINQINRNRYVKYFVVRRYERNNNK